MTANTFGRQVVLPVTNKSGGSLIAGDVVIVDTSNNDAITTTTSAAVTNLVGIAQESIANNAIGRVLFGGYAALVNVNASVTRGNYGQTHTVAKQAADAGSTRQSGTFCKFLTGGTTPDAMLFPPDLGGGSGIAATIFDAKGDLIAATAADTAARLAVGANNLVLTAASGESTGLKWAYPTLTLLQAQLGADVDMTSANTYYDGPTVTLSTGTWLIVATITCDGGGGAATQITAKLWDGTTVINSGEIMMYGGGAWDNQALTLMGAVAVSGTPTWKISAAPNGVSGTTVKIKAAATDNGAGNNASSIVAIKILP